MAGERGERKIIIHIDNYILRRGAEMLNADRIVPVFGWQSQRFYNFANMQKCEDMRKAFFFLMAVLCCVPALARKEYRTLKAQLKDANEGAVENPLNTVNQLIKNDKLKDDPDQSQDQRALQSQGLPEAELRHREALQEHLRALRFLAAVRQHGAQGRRCQGQGQGEI